MCVCVCVYVGELCDCVCRHSCSCRSETVVGVPASQRAAAVCPAAQKPASPAKRSCWRQWPGQGGSVPAARQRPHQVSGLNMMILLGKKQNTHKTSSIIYRCMTVSWNINRKFIYFIKLAQKVKLDTWKLIRLIYVFIPDHLNFFWCFKKLQKTNSIFCEWNVGRAGQ